MQNSFRWYGPNDPVSLSDIRQSNAEYIVTSLHQIPYGAKWSKNDVKKRINFINKYNNTKNINLKWNVVESIPVHNNIKLRTKNFKKLAYGLFFLSIILEAFHFILPNRSFQMSDLFANILGVMVAYFVIKIYLFFNKP